MEKGDKATAALLLGGIMGYVLGAVGLGSVPPDRMRVHEEAWTRAVAAEHMTLELQDRLEGLERGLGWENPVAAQEVVPAGATPDLSDTLDRLDSRVARLGEAVEDLEQQAGVEEPEP